MLFRYEIHRTYFEDTQIHRELDFNNIMNRNRTKSQRLYLVNVNVLELIFERGDDSLEVSRFEALDFLSLRFLHQHCSRRRDFQQVSQRRGYGGCNR